MTRKLRAAAQADDEAVAAMKLDNGAAARLLVKIVDILRDQLMHLAAPLELRQRHVRAIRPCRREPRPSAIAARPIEPPDLRAAHERAVGDGLVPRPRTARASIIRNSGVGAAACAGQNDQPLRSLDELCECCHLLKRFIAPETSLEADTIARL